MATRCHCRALKYFSYDVAPFETFDSLRRQKSVSGRGCCLEGYLQVLAVILGIKFVRGTFEHVIVYTCRWLRLCIRGQWEDMVPVALAFAVENQRMKFCRPIFR